MTVSVVVETWNLHGQAPLSLMSSLAPQVEAIGAEVVVTHSGIAAPMRAQLETALGRDIQWLRLPETAGYYDHKNRGFDASSRPIVAFIDGDCAPSRGWLEALTEPLRCGGAQVVAGATSYPGRLGRLASSVDFPYFEADTPGAVRNFFANNVAFVRDVFGSRYYPVIEPMFHGQCQVLGLRLLRDGIAIRFARAASVTHAWPDGVREWLKVRLLKGADTASLLPYVVEAYAPRATRAVGSMASLPALGVLATRSIVATWRAAVRGPRLSGLGFVAAISVLDSIGAALAPAVYRFVDPG